MRKISLLVLLLLIATLVAAQVDSIYLAGAVPEVNGKVVLTREVKVNSNVNEEKLYDLTKKWIEKEYAKIGGSNQRLLLEKKYESYLVVQGDEKLVFKSNFLSLDQAIMTYHLLVRIEKGKCTLEMRNIKYEYQDYKTLMPAEEMIVDKVALNKQGDKLIRHYDKFRTFTIDRMDGIRRSLLTHLAEISMSDITSAPVIPSIVDEELPQPVPSIKVAGSPAVSVAQPMAVETKTGTIPATKLVPAKKIQPMAGYKEMKADDLSDDIQAMFKDNWVLITSNTDDNIQVETATWGGMSSFINKPMALTIVNAGGKTGEMYTISFFTQIHKSDLDKIADSKENKLTPITTPSGAVAFAEAWMIIECKKIAEEEVSDSVSEYIFSKQWDKKEFDRQSMGQILKIWVR